MKEIADNLVQSVDRAITILETLAQNKGRCGITELSNATGLHKSTVHRLLSTLMSRGYAEKCKDSDDYKLGMKLLALGNAILERLDIREVAKPYIEELSKKTKEVVHLAILDDGEAVYIDKVESPDHSIRMFSQIGRRGPLHCTAVGKMLLAGLEDSEVEKIMSDKGMHKFTKSTIDNINDLKEELAKIRKNGYAFDEIEHEEGIRCVAAPIYDLSGKIVASISLSGPIIHVTHYRMPELTEEILKTAKDISYQLGFTKYSR